MTRTTLAFCLVLMTCFSVSRSSAVLLVASSLPNPHQRSRELTAATQYLGLLNSMRELRADYEASPQWKEHFIQWLSWYESFVGNYSAAIALDDVLVSPRTDTAAAADETRGGYRPEDARDAILKLAETRQVIMVNEAHHMPQHRAFTLTLLRGLYQRGFRYFAAETLDERDTALEKRGYPTLETGYYLRDPVFADLIRTALALGYRVIPYEARKPASPYGSSNPLADINAREREQAENLKNRILLRDPQAKMLVHVGYGHHSEQTTELEFEGKKGELKLMGGRFKELTGIDPLTIDQTVMREHSAPQFENPFYRWANEPARARSHPTVFRNSNREDLRTPGSAGSVDLLVVHPRTRIEDGRPTWLRLRGARSSFRVPKELRAHLKPRCLVQAFIASEEKHLAIPIDQFEVVTGHPKALTLPRKGRFRVRVVDEAANAICEAFVTRQ